MLFCSHSCLHHSSDPSATSQHRPSLSCLLALCLQANEVMQPHLERMPGAQEALEAALAAFPMDQQARAVRRAVSKIGLEDPAGDVRKLMADGGEESSLMNSKLILFAGRP